MHRPAILYALASAALFGVTTPAAKILLGAIDPIVLAGLLYCGAGIGVALLRHIARGTLQGSDAPQVALSRKDVPWLAGAITAGGIAGPILLMFGLAQTDAATASLLLALEGAATALIAWFVFHENFRSPYSARNGLHCCWGHHFGLVRKADLTKRYRTNHKP